jgi:hypothetical protein
MPFDPSTGIYTPPTGAENAAPGQVIRSAIWNTIFTDIATALTAVGQRETIQIPTQPGFGSFTVSAATSVLQIGFSVPTLFLQPASLMTGPLKVMGTAASIFGTNTTVIIASGSDKISGQGTLTLNANFQVATFYPIYAGSMPTGGGYVVTFG